jgi:hypothetical protein
MGDRLRIPPLHRKRGVRVSPSKKKPANAVRDGRSMLLWNNPKNRT